MKRLAEALFATLVLAAGPAGALELDGDGDGDDGLGLELDEGGGKAGAADLDLLTESHLSLLEHWAGVRPRREAREGAAGPHHWAAGPEGVTPLGRGPMTTVIRVPKAGAYRVWLRLRLSTKARAPVTLTVTPQRERGGEFSDAGPGQGHAFGDLALMPATSGREQERRLPVRFESEAELIGFVDRPTMVWERWDVELAAGVHRLSLVTAGDMAGAKPLCHALFMSPSRGFRPSFASSPDDRTFDRVYLRFRVAEGAPERDPYAVNADLTYHWAGRSAKGSTEPMWGFHLGRTDRAPAREWSPFVDGTDALVPGPGPWSTCRLRFDGLASGKVRIEFAWRPHEGAVVHAATVRVDGGAAMLRIPHGAPRVVARSGEAAWGMWPGAYTAGIQPEAEIVERYFSWAEEAAARLGLPADHPRPREVRIFTSCRLGAANQARGVEMLARLGVNWVEGAPPDLAGRLGLHSGLSGYNSEDAEGIARRLSDEERRRYVKHKIGDEIGTHVAAEAVNADPELRSAFREFLEAEAKRHGMGLPEFFGVADARALTGIGSIDSLPENPGRYERRLFHCSQRFAHLASVGRYRSITERFTRLFPNVRVYNNYSPHPPFLTGATMNHSDWFVLCRNQAQTLGWAEDWATGGSWGLGTNYQCTSFYAALVECAARRHGYPSGFYVGVNCGGGARKIFSCVGQGLTWLHLYDWGPIDGWAEGSNAWSEARDQYAAVMTATHALGPADGIIARGKREPRRTAILYNRGHEIWQGGLGRANHDWMWTYIALRGAQVPVDVIVEEDLDRETLAPYRVLYLGGMNLCRRRLAAVREWVEGGGLLIGTAGAASRDCWNDNLEETCELFGARQTLVPAPPPQEGKAPPPAPRVDFGKSELMPAAPFAAAGLRFDLEPEGAEILGRWADGKAAAVSRALGKGSALLLGFQPGIAFRDAERWAKEPSGDVRKWLVAPALRQLGRPRAEYSDPDSEVTLFEDDSGVAVLLAAFHFRKPEGRRLSVKVGRPVAKVTSALRGELRWTERDGRVEIDVPPIEPVDAIIIACRGPAR